MARFRATPYARALYDVAGTAEKAEEWVEPVARVAQALHEVPQFLKAMVTPMVKPEVKTKILDKILDELAIEEPVRRFAHVVQQHYRLEHMTDIAAAYRAEVDRGLGRVHAVVEAATPLDDADRATLLSVLREVVGADVVADFVKTPELLAGFKIQVGSKVFDGSLIGQLKQLGRQTQIERG